MKSLGVILRGGLLAVIATGMFGMLIISPVAATDEKSIKRSGESTLQWALCEGAPTTPARECAEIGVPLDYTNPAKGTTPLQLARIKASNPDPAVYQGTLFFIPGGPPSAGVNYVGYTANIDRWIAPEIRAVYDVVGIQQLGSWNGTPCIDGAAVTRYWQANHLPKTTEQLNAVMALEKEYNDGCVRPENALVPYMNTARSIRDMDTVRQALGINKVSLFGYSYGTALAHGYMSKYPTHVKRAVLDSVVDRSLPDPIQSTENIMEWEKAWQRFKDWCQSDSACVLKGQDIDQAFSIALAAARTTGIPAPRNPFGNRPVNDWQFLLTIQALTGAGEATRLWAATLLKDAANGDGSQAGFMYDLLTGRRPDGTNVGGDGTRRAYSCNDTIWSELFRKPEDVKNWVRATELAAPRFGAVGVYQGVAQCYKWSLPPVSPQPLIELVSAGVRALLINATHDVSTPLTWAKRVQMQIPGSKLVVVSGASHLQSIKSRCAMEHAKNYLVNGVLPTDGTTCTYDSDLLPPQLPPDLGPAPFSGTGVAGPHVSSDFLRELHEQYPAIR